MNLGNGIIIYHLYIFSTRILYGFKLMVLFYTENQVWYNILELEFHQIGRNYENTLFEHEDCV